MGITGVRNGGVAMGVARSELMDSMDVGAAGVRPRNKLCGE